jgi:hypothetical protein
MEGKEADIRQMITNKTSAHLGKVRRLQEYM